MSGLIILFGLIIGSFLNALIYRLYSGQSISSGRSACPHCGHVLGAMDLIPVVSFIWLRGQCRYCHKKISWQYPIVELVTATVFLLIAGHFGFQVGEPAFWVNLFFAAVLIVIGVFDFKHYLILDKVLLPVGILALLWNLYQDLSGAGPSFSGYLVLGVVSGLGLAVFFGLQYVLSRGKWIGLGDVKLGWVMGNMLNWPLSLCMLMLAYFSGAFTGVILIGLGRKQMSSKLPFGLFLAFSGIITMLWGDKIVAWYLGLIGF
jgi:leader peptidase (prepilin peptidase)/N-methyltransferase